MVQMARTGELPLRVGRIDLLSRGTGIGLPQ